MKAIHLVLLLLLLAAVVEDTLEAQSQLLLEEEDILAVETVEAEATGEVPVAVPLAVLTTVEVEAETPMLEVAVVISTNHTNKSSFDPEKIITIIKSTEERHIIKNPRSFGPENECRRGP